ncbi:hypothetical protein ACFWTE_03275 [Nocardiopsis sp. NPDC058631]|uniref:hypothetical protein n=1 Tax=Nocardiopsis sp. NPDC058631 TaxID=3346566 RepID=UPI00364EDD99
MNITLRIGEDLGADQIVALLPFEAGFDDFHDQEKLAPLGRSLRLILLVNGGSAVRPSGGVAGTSVAFARESAYGQMLHDALAPEGIHVAELIIPRGIGGGEPDHEPDALAERIWSLHRDRGAFGTLVGGGTA